MKILITPSKEMKNIGFKGEKQEALFQDKRSLILENLKGYSIEKLCKTFGFKENIAEKSYNQWQEFEYNKEYPAIYFFNGLMYRNMDLENLKDEEIEYIESNLRILSPLYGVIRPFDGIKEHRLDFMKNIMLSNGEKLINFWKEDISNYLLSEDEIFINLLSDEFLKVLNKEVVEKSVFFKFRELKDGKLKTHSTISKKARGLFIKFLAENNIEKLEDAKEFNYNGYSYDMKNSKERELIFIKKVD